MWTKSREGKTFMKCGAVTAASPVAVIASAAAAEAATATPANRLRRTIPFMSERRVAVRPVCLSTRSRAGPVVSVTSFLELVGGRLGRDYAEAVRAETGDFGRRTVYLQGFFTESTR